MKNFPMLYGFLVVLLVGCGIGNAKTPKVTLPTAPPENTSSPIFTQTASSKPLITPTVSIQKCPQVLSTLPTSSLSGMIVFGQIPGNTPPLPAFLWNINGQVNLPRDKDEYFGGDMIEISPDRKWLAYLKYYNPAESDGIQFKLSIIDSKGVLSKEITVSKAELSGVKNWNGLLGWQNNDDLLIDISALSSPYPILVFNPFTGLSEELMPDFPNIYKTSQNFMAWWHSYAAAITIYDSAFQLVLYPKSPTDLVLWDIKQKRELAKIHTQNPYGSRPKWSPDNQTIIIDASVGSEYFSDEILAVNRKGDVKLLTDFRNTIGPVDVQEYNWSPDGNYIAFWYATNPEDANSIYELAILNIKTGEITNYCVFDRIRPDEITLLAPIWSPDGEQLIVRGDTENNVEGGTNNIFLIDIVENYIVKIKENVVPLGWMVDTP